MGCDRVVVLLTRERSYRKEPEKLIPLLRPAFRQYPNFLDTMARRADRYNESRERLFALEREGRALVIAPESTAGFSRTEKDLGKIRRLWQSGYAAGRKEADRIRRFWSQPEL